MNTTLKGLISSFTKSVDIYNYLLKNHHRRTAIAAYHIGKAMNLSDHEISDLVIGAALHDIGALTVQERDDLVQMDVENPYPHSMLGCYMLESFEPFQPISRILFYHHWPYDQDYNWNREKGKVPLASYILHVADRIEILIDHDQHILTQKEKVKTIIHSYKGTLFHPAVVEAFDMVSLQDIFWLDIENMSMNALLKSAISSSMEVELSLDMLEQFAFTISKIIDVRSKFTISHSYGVSAVSYHIAALLGYSDQKKREIRVAGLLHDIGKIAISPSIIEKTALLDPLERSQVQAHAYFTSVILNEIEGLGDIGAWASNHHENHDGSGYPKHISNKTITEEMDIIAYADIYTALCENRPYRASLPTSEIISILSQHFTAKHGSRVFNIIKSNVDDIDVTCKNAILDGEIRYQEFEEFSKRTNNIA